MCWIRWTGDDFSWIAPLDLPQRSCLIYHKGFVSTVIIAQVSWDTGAVSPEERVMDCSSCHIILSSLVESAAADNSILGIVSGFKGVRQGFLIRKEHQILPWESTTLR